MVLNEHNKRSVERIVNSFEHNEKVLYVSGVGTGKSFVFMQIMLMFQNLRAMYIMPKHAIKENICNYPEFKKVEGRVDFFTYNSFTSVEVGMRQIEPYDLVVIDEAHHLGSDIYGKAILGCMKLSKNTNFLGLTATPIREHGHVDVTSFFEDRIDGISHFEAIEQGLMPKFEYRLCLPAADLADAIKDNPEISVKLDYCDCEDVMKSILKTYPRNKWLCFFNKIDSITKHREMIDRIFPGYEIFVLHSDLNNLKYVMEGFNNAKKAVILSCNMLLEGVHLEGVDAIGLFRNVTSIVAFQQILGRVCKIGSKVEPVVVDNSSSGPAMMFKLLSESEKTVKKRKSGGRTRSVKDILKIGLNDHESWDGIDELLKKLDSRYAAYQTMLDNAGKTYDKYIHYNGSTKYESFDELKKNQLDYKKFKACAEVCDISPAKAFALLYEMDYFPGGVEDE